MTGNSHNIKLLRGNGFNCFPIPKYPKDSKKSPKGADTRYQASKTKTDQPIKQNENYGYMARVGYHNCVIDVDSEIYEEQIKEMAKEYLVVKSGKGYHIPVVDLYDDSEKVELFDYSVQNEKIIEIQGVDHYVMGIGSEIFHPTLKKYVKYENIGTEKFLSANNERFDLFVDRICDLFEVVKRKRTKQQHYRLRQRFLDGKPPIKGTSNDYFYDAGIQCLTDKLSIGQALEKVQEVYDKWENPTRSWSNVEAKIIDAYENGTPLNAGRPNKDERFDRTEVAVRLSNERNLFSDYATKKIYENKQGFLEPIEEDLFYELQKQYPIMEKNDFEQVLSKLLGLSEKMPERNKDLIVFRNGIYSISKGRLLKSSEIKDDDIAYSGFKDHDYIRNPNPKRFLKVAFGNIPKEEHERLEAGLRGILRPYKDSKISVIQGKTGVGKSATLTIIHLVLSEQYSLVIDNDKLISDPASRVELEGKLLAVIQELPQVWNKFNQIKRLTGEESIAERGNFKNLQIIKNTTKYFATVNNLPRIPVKDEDVMFGRRLSLVINTKSKPYPQVDGFEEDIAKDEGSDILSYLVNLTSKSPSYEDEYITKTSWKSLANPELEYINTHFRSAEFNEVGERIPLQIVLKELQNKFPRRTFTTDDIDESCKQIGINIFARCLDNVVRIESKVKQGGLTP